jgi:hypothetical protein
MGESTTTKQTSTKHHEQTTSPSVSYAAKQMTINPNKSDVYIKAVNNSVATVVRGVTTRINSEAVKSND